MYPSAAVAGSLVVAAILSWAAWPWLRMGWVARRLPGPPLWRQLLYGLSCLRGTAMVFETIIDLMQTYGPVACLQAGPKVIIFISSPEDARLVLHHSKIQNRDVHVAKGLNTLFDHTLVTVRDEVARSRRKMMAPGLSTKVILATYIEAFTRTGEKLCERLDQLAGGHTFDVKDEINILAADTFFETGIGSRMDWSREQWVELTQSILAGNVLMFRRLIRPWLQLDWLFALVSEGKKMKRVRQTVIAKLKQGFAKNNQSRDSIEGETDERGRKLVSFIDMMRSSKAASTTTMTEDQLQEECILMTAASMETTGKTMAYVLTLLGMHPKHQDKAAEEQRDVFGDSLRPATTEDIAKMPILDHIIKETLRLFPPINALVRELAKDVEITEGHILPAGAMVFISNFMLHRDAANFEEPESFRPERWAEESGGRHSYAYIPFGRGPRSCVAQHYSYLQMKTTLSRVLRQFRFTSGYTMRDLRKIKMNFTILSEAGYKVEVFRRGVLRKGDALISEVILQHG